MTQAGPGVMKLDVAITDAENAINHWADLLATKLSGWKSVTEVAQ